MGQYRLWVICVDLTVRRLLPVYPSWQTFSEPVGMSQRCHKQTSGPASLAEIKPPLLNRDGKTADQPCDRFQVPGVLVFEQSGEPLNTFVVAVQQRYVIDWSFGL